MRDDLVIMSISGTASGNYPAVSGGAPAAIFMKQAYGFSLIVKPLAGQTGTLKVQVSNDTDAVMMGNTGTPIWADLANGSLTINGAAVQTLNIDAVYYRWLRLDWTRSGGATSFVAQLNVKGP